MKIGIHYSNPIDVQNHIYNDMGASGEIIIELLPDLQVSNWIGDGYEKKGGFLGLDWLEWL